MYAQDGYDDEIIVPVKRDFSDYALVVSKIILTLSEAGKRDELSIVRDLSLARFDRIRVRIPEDDGNGSISLDSGVTLLETVARYAAVGSLLGEFVLSVSSGLAETESQMTTSGK